ncbi:hypothetical protein N2152v2_011299 [Parachlorella kessleri]
MVFSLKENKGAAARRRLEKVSLGALLVVLPAAVVWLRYGKPVTFLAPDAYPASTVVLGEGRYLASLEAARSATIRRNSSGTERSWYLPWIHKDLARWRHGGIGISKAMVDKAHARVRDCTAWSQQPFWIRFQVVDGKLYVEHWDAPQGHYPAELGRGWVSAKARLPYAILALMDVLREFPGEIPDLDAVLGLQDSPCIVLEGNDSQQPAPPAFGFTGAPWAADLPFPDFTYYGHEVGLGLEDEKGQWLFGWDAQLDHYIHKWSSPLWDRIPRLVWRGRTTGMRDQPRKYFAVCPHELRQQNDSGSAHLFNTPGSGGLAMGEGHIHLDTMCQYMYQAYLEAAAYSSNLKQKLACRSVVLTPYIQHYEFWSRELRPGKHYLLVTTAGNDTECTRAAKTMKAINAYMFGSETSRSLLAGAAKNTSSNSSSSSSSMGADGKARSGTAAKAQQYPWGSELTPQQIADEGRKFLEAHVRMRDVKLYLRDMLREYAQLLDFQPVPGDKSRCYTGKRLLKEFAVPFPEDAEDVLQRYPWLAQWDPGCTRWGWGKS